jgi:transcriptional regulator with XRE-family HTH domain
VELRNSPKTEVVERVKAILASKGLTLYQVSQRTRSLYGRSSPYFLPHNLYYDLGLGTFSPSLYQLFALSQISDCRLNDWLRVFGFNPEEIVRLQVLLSSKRTLLLDSSLDDSESWVPWFRNKPGNLPAPAIAPIGQLLDFAPLRRIHSLSQAKNSNFVYAKIGHEDAFAFPDLLPGSIVRTNTRLAKSMLPTANGKASESLFLIEHASGLCCCRLQAVGNNRIMPLSTQLPYAQVELQLPDEVRVLGVVALEIRSLLEPAQPDVPKALAKHWRPLTLAQEDTKLSHWLRSARLRMGLSFREASAMSRRIASELGDEQYFTAPGSLSDYEARDTPPRHIHKAITLCAIYGLHFSTFLKIIGLHVEEAGKDPIPDKLVPREIPIGFRSSAGETDEPPGNGFLEQLLSRSERVPFFLRESLASLSGLTTPSLHDFFWVGGERNAFHPLLVNGLLVVVNRHKKKPIHFRSKPLWQQPLYVLLRRDGTYMCACCSLENGTLVIHPCTSDHQRPEQLRNHADAEVVGQIVTIARRL